MIVSLNVVSTVSVVVVQSAVPLAADFIHAREALAYFDQSAAQSLGESEVDRFELLKDEKEAELLPDEDEPELLPEDDGPELLLDNEEPELLLDDEPELLPEDNVLPLDEDSSALLVLLDSALPLLPEDVPVRPLELVELESPCEPGRFVGGTDDDDDDEDKDEDEDDEEALLDVLACDVSAMLVAHASNSHRMKTRSTRMVVGEGYTTYSLEANRSCFTTDERARACCTIYRVRAMQA